MFRWVSRLFGAWFGKNESNVIEEEKVEPATTEITENVNAASPCIEIDFRNIVSERIGSLNQPAAVVINYSPVIEMLGLVDREEMERELALTFGMKLEGIPFVHNDQGYKKLLSRIGIGMIDGKFFDIGYVQRMGYRKKKTQAKNWGKWKKKRK